MSSIPSTVVCAGVLMLAACTTAGVNPAVRRGAFAFHYGAVLTEEAIADFSRFDVLVTHDPLPREQVARLRAAGTRLVLYEWAVAFYESRATDWQRALLQRREALLNSAPLTGGAGSATAPAWYFDPAEGEHAEARVADLVRRLTDTGYDGVFLDTTTIQSVHPEARKVFERRHPRVSYDLAFSRFLRALRERLPDGLIFTNQGYRSPEHYLPYVDWDLTESLITQPAGEGWRVRPWNDPNDPWNSIHFVMRTMIQPLVERYPHVRFGHLNYAATADTEVTRLVVAVAHLFGGEGYVGVEGNGAAFDPSYFLDPGRPLAARVDREEGLLSHRAFENVMVVVSASPRATTLSMPCGRVVTVPASPDGPRAFFFDNRGECGHQE